MNDPNEEAVIAVFQAKAKGAWLTVQALRAYLSESRPMSERTLYRVLRRLAKRGILANTPTQDRGALYALAPVPKGSREVVQANPARGQLAAGFSAPIRIPGEWTQLGTLTVPPGVTKITKIAVSVKQCEGPFVGPADGQGRRYCVRDQRPHFDVRTGPLPKLCPAMLKRDDEDDARTIQCGLPRGHGGQHEVPPSWSEWWETGQIVLGSEPKP